jgi:hypothetical protein
MLLKRRASVVVFVLWASAAAALTPAEQVIEALQAKGYVVIVQERTWLGRLRIVAVTKDMRREVVINPGTGEILRDFSAALWPDSNQSGSDGAPQVATGQGTSPAVTGGSDTTLSIAAGREVQEEDSVPSVVLSDPLVVEAP